MTMSSKFSVLSAGWTLAAVARGCSGTREGRRNPMPPLEGATTTADTHITSVMGAGVM